LFTDGEVRAWVSRELSVLSKVGSLEGCVSAFTPVGQLAEGHKSVAISRPVVANVPVDEDTDSGQTNIGTDNEVTDENRRSDNWFIVSSGRLVHDIWVRRVEGKGGGWETVSDEIDPEELDGVETIGNTHN